MRSGTGWTRREPHRTVMQSAYCPICRVRTFHQAKGRDSDDASEEPLACSLAHVEAVRVHIFALLERWLDSLTGDREIWVSRFRHVWELANDYALIADPVARWAQDELRRRNGVPGARQAATREDTP